MLRFLTGVAAVALAASAVSAEPDGGKGGGDKGRGGGKDRAALAQGGPGGDRQDRGEDARGEGNNGRDRGEEMRGGGNARPDRGDEMREAREDRGRGDDDVREARGNDDNRDRGNDDGFREARRRDEVRSRDGRDDDGDVRIVRDVRVDGDRRGFDWHDLDRDRSRGLIDGCPPGLAKKNNGCMPPGLAKKRPAFWDRADWWEFDRDRFDRADWNDGRYRYYDGYMIRYGDRGIESWLPLLGGALAPGNVWPSQYGLVNLPPYYEDYYGLGAADAYRYYDDTLFRIDPQSNAITAIAALLTGNSFNVGQRMPLGYDVYNVPYSYRDQYVDSPDAYYRYSDGYVYEIDPTTQLIQAAIQLLA